MSDERCCRECNEGNCVNCLVVKCQCQHRVPEEAVTAAMVAIHDVECGDRTCNGSALGHYRTLALAALGAAQGAIRVDERRQVVALIRWEAQDYRRHSEAYSQSAGLALENLARVLEPDRGADDIAALLDADR